MLENVLNFVKENKFKIIKVAAVLGGAIIGTIVTTVLAPKEELAESDNEDVTTVEITGTVENL
jgi:hypothetical protein